MLWTSDAWSTSHLSQQTSEPAYYIVDCRIFSFRGNYSFLNLETVANSNSCHNISFLYLIKLNFCFRNYSSCSSLPLGEKVRRYQGLRSFHIGMKYHKWKHIPKATVKPFSFKWPFENTVIWPSVHPSLLDFGGFVLRLHHQSGAKKEDNPISFWLPTLLSFFGI